MRRLCAILTATTLIGGLAACSSAPEGSGDHTGNGGQTQQHDEQQQRPAYLTAANALSADQDAVLADMQAPAGERTHDYERRAVVDALRDR